MLFCPNCHEKLIQEQARFLCANGHSFDIAKEGYINLLPANQKHSGNPGDTKEMVRSRRAFLQKGYYAPFANQLAELVSQCLSGIQSPNIIDIGCGEGYYTGFIKNAAGAGSTLLGFDISKWAVKYAAKQNKNCLFAVASAFHMPISDARADLAVNIFSPLALDEIHRVLKEHGYFIYAVPGPRHLYELKQILYEKPHENEEKDTPYPGFTLLRRVPVQGTITLNSAEDIQSLFTMTPYYWKTPKEGAQRLENRMHLNTEIHFDFLVYQKSDRE